MRHSLNPFRKHLSKTISKDLPQKSEPRDEAAFYVDCTIQAIGPWVSHDHEQVKKAKP